MVGNTEFELMLRRLDGLTREIPSGKDNLEYCIRTLYIVDQLPYFLPDSFDREQKERLVEYGMDLRIRITTLKWNKLI